MIETSNINGSGATTMGPPKHAPENRRQALKDRKPLLPDSALNPLDADLEMQLEHLIDATNTLDSDANEDVLAMQAKAGTFIIHYTDSIHSCIDIRR